MVLEDLVTTELCPTDSTAARRNCNMYDHPYGQLSTKNKSWNSWTYDQCTVAHTVKPLLHNLDGDVYESYTSPYLLESADINPVSYVNVLQARQDKDMHEDHTSRWNQQDTHTKQSVQELRHAHMTGWGDQIGQYYIVQSMLKLNPAQIMYLHNTVLTKSQLEIYVAHQFGPGAEDWFWNNGQTWLDTWNLVLAQRGEDAGCWRESLLEGICGIAPH